MSRIAIVHFVNYKRGTQSRAAMRGVMLYVMQEKKTAWEDGPLVSGINCQPQSVYDDFLNTKLLYHKDDGTMFYHMVQSFPKGGQSIPDRPTKPRGGWRSTLTAVRCWSAPMSTANISTPIASSTPSISTPAKSCTWRRNNCKS